MFYCASLPPRYHTKLYYHSPGLSSSVAVAGFYGTELYPANATGGDPITVPKYPNPPTDFPWMSGQWQDGDQRDPALGCPDCVMPLDHQREIRRWRKAAVTWTDHQLGKMHAHM